MTAMLNQAAHSGLLPFCRRFGGFVAGIGQEGRTSPSELPPPPVWQHCKSCRRLRKTRSDYVILHLFHLKQWKQGLEHIRK